MEFGFGLAAKRAGGCSTSARDGIVVSEWEDPLVGRLELEPGSGAPLALS